MANQSEISAKFFCEYLTKSDFIKKQYAKYFWQVIKYGKNKIDKIEFVLDNDYTIRIAKESECKLDLKKFKEKNNPFFVKVFNSNNHKHEYLSTENGLFEKLKATSTASPLSSFVQIGNERYIDGDSIKSNIDLDILEKFKDKTIIKIENYAGSKLKSFVSFPAKLIIAELLGKLFDYKTAKIYLKNIFINDESKRLSSYKNLILIKNDVDCPMDCTDVNKLEKIFLRGTEKGKIALEKI